MISTLPPEETMQVGEVKDILRPHVMALLEDYKPDVVAAALAHIALRELEGSSPSCKLLELTLAMISAS